MRVKILDETFEVANEIKGVDHLISKINELIGNSNLVLSHMSMDGVEVYDNFHGYLTENISHIREIELKFYTPAEFLTEVLVSVDQYLIRAIPEIKKLSDEFYLGATDGTWHKFAEFLEGMEWLFRVTDYLYKQKNGKGITEISKQIEDELGSLEEAIRLADRVLIGDILIYEIVSRLESMYSIVKKTIDNEVVSNDIN